MRFLHMKLNSLPTVIYAHGCKTSEYCESIKNDDGVFEIFQNEMGTVIKTYDDGRTQTILPHTICTHVHDDPCTLECRNELHQQFTLGIRADFTYDFVESDNLNTDNKPDADSSFGTGIMTVQPEGQTNLTDDAIEIYLPESISADSDTGLSEQILRRIIRAYTESGGKCDLNITQILFELFRQLTYACTAASGTNEYDHDKSFSSSLYVRRSIQYIDENIDRKITVSEIADYLGISAEHLSKQFHAVTGKTVIEYINKLKLDKVKEYIITNNMSLREAGEQVEITDVNYLSRLFKRYIGITASEYKILHRTYCGQNDKEFSRVIDREFKNS